MDLHNQTAVVTGGSRGLGLGLVEALVDRGAKVTVVARTASDLENVSRRLGVATVAADVTDQAEAARILAELRPAILALNAGAPPRAAPLDEQSWEGFSTCWDTDVKAGLFWLQAALRTPLPPGSRVLVGSSGAAVAGSPLSGGYHGRGAPGASPLFRAPGGIGVRRRGHRAGRPRPRAGRRRPAGRGDSAAAVAVPDRL